MSESTKNEDNMKSVSHWGMFEEPILPKRRSTDKPKIVIKHKICPQKGDLKLDINA